MKILQSQFRARAICLAFFIVCACLLMGCATGSGIPSNAEPTSFFRDHLFAPPQVKIDAKEVFAVNDAMRRYLREDIGRQLRMEGKQRGLYDALYAKTQLKLEYDAVKTLTAAEAFESRNGNCLSLVILAAALAKQIDVPVYFHRVIVEDTWSRHGGIHFASGHVNITFGRPSTAFRVISSESDLLMIDFVPHNPAFRIRATNIGEETIVAMYMNNRAAETLATGNTNDAYWWARAAVLQDASFLSSYNTLGVIYNRLGQRADAERVLLHVLAHEPQNLQAMSNLILVLNETGRAEESNRWRTQLAKLQPDPPFRSLNLGIAAMRGGDFREAKALFKREVSVNYYSSEAHYWLANALMALGETKDARAHLDIAAQSSTNRRDAEIYQGKLAKLKTAGRVGSGVFNP
jgi:tetratricopeptide (TPR) repeat protein